MEFLGGFGGALAYYNVVMAGLGTMPFLYFDDASPFRSSPFAIYVICWFWFLCVIGEIEIYKDYALEAVSSVVVPASISLMMAVVTFIVSLCLTVYYLSDAQQGFEFAFSVSMIALYALLGLCFLSILICALLNMKERANYIERWKMRASYRNMMYPYSRKYRELIDEEQADTDNIHEI